MAENLKEALEDHYLEKPKRVKPSKEPKEPKAPDPEMEMYHGLMRRKPGK